MRYHRAKHQGFTIVELAVVIVVIAILATITVVTYESTTKNAYNAQIIAGVRSHYDAIKAYKLAKGVYPSTQREEDDAYIAMTCLGTGYEDQHCGEITNVEVYEDTLFNTQMKSFLKTTLNPVSDASLPVPGESYVGAAYGLDETFKSGTGYGRVIEYALYGDDVDCGIAEAWEYSASAKATACEIFLEDVAIP